MDMPDTPGGPTLLDIFAKQVELGVQLAVITEQLKQLPDHEMRIRSIERFRFTLAGLAVGVPVCVTTLGIWIEYLVTHRG
jgi:hypothetical protein